MSDAFGLDLAGFGKSKTDQKVFGRELSMREAQ